MPTTHRRRSANADCPGTNAYIFYPYLCPLIASSSQLSKAIRFRRPRCARRNTHLRTVHGEPPENAEESPTSAFVTITNMSLSYPQLSSRAVLTPTSFGSVDASSSDQVKYTLNAVKNLQ